MTPEAMLITTASVAVLGVAAFAVFLRVRYHVRWSTWAWGALTFIVSQLLRLPLLSAANTMMLDVNPTTLAVVSIALALITSGVFEEVSRWLMLTFVAKRDRTRSDGLMFGAGHAGSEAILVFVFAAVSGLFVLSGGDALVEQAQAVSPAQAGAVAAQLESLRTLTWWEALLGLWERVPATVFHIAATLAVLRAVREQAARWLWLAIGLHIAFNTVAVLTNQWAGIAATEVLITLMGVGFLWAILRGWGAPRHFVDAGSPA